MEHACACGTSKTQQDSVSSRRFKISLRFYALYSEFLPPSTGPGDDAVPIESGVFGVHELHAIAGVGHDNGSVFGVATLHDEGHVAAAVVAPVPVGVVGGGLLNPPAEAPRDILGGGDLRSQHRVHCF